MNKIPFIAAIAALSLAACSEDEPVSVNTRTEYAIDFRPAIGDQSRATETTNSNLSKITVSSFIGDKTYFNKIEFNKGNDGYFTSLDKYFWPGDTTSVVFYAYSPTEDELGADIVLTPETKELQDFTVATDIADQVDFITTNATGRRDVNEKTGVALTFAHRLAQI